MGFPLSALVQTIAVLADECREEDGAWARRFWWWRTRRISGLPSSSCSPSGATGSVRLVMDGDALLAEVSRHPPQRPLRIIVISANLDVQRRGAYDHVTAAFRKPVPPDRLHAAVDAEVHAFE